jgi:hypothetical protein
MKIVTIVAIALTMTSAAAQEMTIEQHRRACVDSSDQTYCLNELAFCREHYDAAKCAEVLEAQAALMLLNSEKYCSEWGATPTDVKICIDGSKRCMEQYYARRSAPWTRAGSVAAADEKSKCNASFPYNIKTHR